MSDGRRVKFLHDEHIGDERCSKIRRNDIDVTPTADVDTKLAEKLDRLLTINHSSKHRFKTNKPRSHLVDESRAVSDMVIGEQSTLKQRNLTKEELRVRLIKNYDTLVPELDPKRAGVKVVEILSAKESIELGKNQARKQILRDLELNCVSGNRFAHKINLKSLRSNDSYELRMKNSTTKNTAQNRATTSSLSPTLKDGHKESTAKASKSVEFDDNISYRDDVRDDNESDYDDDDDDSTESDCSTVDD